MLLTDLFSHRSRVAQHPIFKDACAIWDFASESGDRCFDKSIVDRPYHGAFAGTGGNAISRSPTFYGTAIRNSNDGTNRRVDLGSITSSDMLSGVPSGSLSVFWHGYYRSTGASSFWPRLIEKTNGGGGAQGWVANIYESSAQLQMYAGGFSWGFAHGLTSDQYATFVWKMKSGAQEAYVNGISIGTGATSFSFSSTTTNAALTNWNHSTDREWHHDNNIVAVWPRALTDVEVLALHNDAMNMRFRYVMPIRFPIQGAAPPIGWGGTINEISDGGVNEITNANIQSVNEI